MTVPPFFRRIELTARDNSVVASIEDYQHHFEVSLTHDGETATSITGRAERAPWTPCGDAAGELRELVGAPIARRPRVGAPNRHCTHQLDIACLAVRFAGCGISHRTFEVTVSAWDSSAALAVLERDDGFRLEWTFERSQITSPPPYAGHGLGSGFTEWALSTLEPDVAEAALILRRAAWMAPARGVDLDSHDVASESGLTEGVCYTGQPARIRIARRNRGAARVVQPASSQ
jgi:hypothetical protein